MLQHYRGSVRIAFNAGSDEVSVHFDFDGDGKVLTIDVVRNFIFGETLSSNDYPLLRLYLFRSLCQRADPSSASQYCWN